MRLTPASHDRPEFRLWSRERVPTRVPSEVPVNNTCALAQNVGALSPSHPLLCRSLRCDGRTEAKGPTELQEGPPCDGGSTGRFGVVCFHFLEPFRYRCDHKRGHGPRGVKGSLPSIRRDRQALSNLVVNVKRLTRQRKSRRLLVLPGQRVSFN
jgi:hypothetical protein